MVPLARISCFATLFASPTDVRNKFASHLSRLYSLDSGRNRALGESYRSNCCAVAVTVNFFEPLSKVQSHSIRSNQPSCVSTRLQKMSGRPDANALRLMKPVERTLAVLARGSAQQQAPGDRADHPGLVRRYTVKHSAVFAVRQAIRRSNQSGRLPLRRLHP